MKLLLTESPTLEVRIRIKQVFLQIATILRPLQLCIQFSGNIPSNIVIDESTGEISNTAYLSTGFHHIRVYADGNIDSTTAESSVRKKNNVKPVPRHKNRIINDLI